MPRDPYEFDEPMGNEEYEDNAQAAHKAFMEGVEDTEGVIVTHDPLTAPHIDYQGASIESDDIEFNPAVSEAQQRLMGAALARKRAGHPRKGDPEMSEEQLREFARKRR